METSDGRVATLAVGCRDAQKVGGGPLIIERLGAKESGE